MRILMRKFRNPRTFGHPMNAPEAGTPAVLCGEPGVFRFSVLGYEFDKPDDVLDWLVTRIVWEGNAVNVYLGAQGVEAGELRRWADELGRIAEELSDDRKVFTFIEPCLVMACEKSSPRGHFSITLELHGEPALRGEHFSVEFEVDQGELRGFAAALGAWSDRFPHRGKVGSDPMF
jgi:hypothetical protein